METTTPNLTTAAGILDAYLLNYTTDPAQKKDGRAISPEEFHKRLKALPTRDCVNACVERKQFDLAIVFLDSAYFCNRPGSSEDLELARLGMDMAEVCLKEKKMNYVEWALNRAYEIYPEESSERRQVIEKGVSLVDDFTAPGDAKLGNLS